MMTIELIRSLSDETLSTRRQESVSRFQMSLQLAINKLTIDQEIAVLVTLCPGDSMPPCIFAAPTLLSFVV